MIQRRFLTNLLLASVMSFSFSVQAQEHGTKDEAKAMTERAVAHMKKVGATQAFKDFNEDKANWRVKDMYVFAIDWKGIALAHANPKAVGRDLSEYTDQSGKYYVRELAQVAQTKGSGWVEYDATNPQTKKPEDKQSFVMKMPNYEGFVGVGVYR